MVTSVIGWNDDEDDAKGFSQRAVALLMIIVNILHNFCHGKLSKSIVEVIIKSEYDENHSSW